MRTELLRSGDTICIMFAFEQTLDRQQVEEMAQVVQTAIATHRDLRLLLDLRDTAEFLPDAFVSPKGLIASVRSIGPVARYAVVGAPRIAAVAVETFGKILPMESQAFAADQIEQARGWVLHSDD